MRLGFDTTQTIDRRYILDRQLGKGGMGAVYEAFDRLSGETVALKLVLSPPGDLDFASKGGGLDLNMALAQEFKTLASLRHPNIISVLNYGFDKTNRPYFTMDLLDNALSPARAVWGKPDAYKVDMLIQILQALSYLHRRDIIHRDLKPANVRVVKEQVKVLDFGLSTLKSKQQEEDSDKIVGTIEYMAPELLRQHPPSIETDLYAVGVVGWELFTGEYLFDATDIRKVAQEIFHKIPDPAEVGNDRVGLVLARLLSKEPENRYRSADETIAALCAAIDIPLPPESVAIRESFLQAATLVGREREIDLFSEKLQEARAGRGSGWLIAGESGVGKSRLLDEIRVRALVDGAIVVRGEAISTGRSPYQIWREVIRNLILGANIDRREAGILQPVIPDIDKLLEIKPA
ncbi:MAG TPA: serine/threonine-protein kinase, partial [Aggregatilineales bacterium]|nr:serine/threonine-protein kinase [Aggregatilineales bacterium]